MCLQQECTKEVDVWHNGVCFYKIFNKSGNTVVLVLQQFQSVVFLDTFYRTRSHFEMQTG